MKRVGSAFAVAVICFCCAFVSAQELATDIGERIVRVPTRWIYAENDNWFGPKVARDWHGRYLRGGAHAEFVMLQPFGPEGHYAFTRAIPHWRPLVERFFAVHGVHPNAR